METVVEMIREEETILDRGKGIKIKSLMKTLNKLLRFKVHAETTTTTTTKLK